MVTRAFNYFRVLTERFGSGWNQFWFAPSGAETLSAMRPMVGILAMCWLATYTADLVAFFGPGGVIPPELLAVWSGNASGAGGAVYFSYLTWATSPSALMAAHWLGLLVLLAFTVGIFTRVTAPLGLIVVLSYIHRGPMLTSEFEPVLAMTMFYLTLGEVLSLFERRGPAGIWLLLGGACGASYSIDAWLRNRAQAQSPQLHAQEDDSRESTTSVTLATRLLQIHLAAIYVMSGLGMLSFEAWWAGEAVWYLIARPDQPSFSLASRLYNQWFIVNAWTHFIMFTHLAFGVLIWNRLARPLVIGLAVLMWLLVGVASGMILYSLMMITATLAFVSPEVIARSAILPEADASNAGERLAGQGAPADVTGRR